MDEQKWNKDNGRDYSKEYNAPGSKAQEERNKRKRDKRKHDKLYGECKEEAENIKYAIATKSAMGDKK